jgi:hypothetical protein
MYERCCWCLISVHLVQQNIIRKQYSYLFGIQLLKTPRSWIYSSTSTPLDRDIYLTLSQIPLKIKHIILNCLTSGRQNIINTIEHQNVYEFFWQSKPSTRLVCRCTQFHKKVQILLDYFLPARKRQWNAKVRSEEVKAVVGISVLGIDRPASSKI